MKILTPEQIYLADQTTIKNTPIKSVDLMERVGKLCYERIIALAPEQSHVFYVFCGVGNNGGDGLVISRYLLENNYQVKTFIVNFSPKFSADFSEQLKRLEALNCHPININSETDFPEIPTQAILIDAIFGLGLKRSPEGFTKLLIQYLNHQNNPIIAIDFPSGLFANAAVVNKTAVIQAAHTITFQVPKLAFLLPDNQNFITTWEVLDIGLDQEFLNSVASPMQLTNQPEILKIYKARLRFSHKGTFGHSLLIGGSYGKIGAMVLASSAAIRAGSGLVTTLIPKCGYTILQTAVPEAMCLTSEAAFINDFKHNISASAIGIGMGMGLNDATQKAFLNFLETNTIPLVVDADALNTLALHKSALKLLPKDSILTPHPKELERLIGVWTDDYQKLEKLKTFSKTYQIIVILKGAYTVIVKGDDLYFNSTGNPALATGGSGDVLTGIITGLLAQQYTSLEAAILGVYLHGCAADFALADGFAQESLIASDIIKYLSKAFNSLQMK